jgi:hypothetical protein
MICRSARENVSVQTTKHKPKRKYFLKQTHHFKQKHEKAELLDIVYLPIKAYVDLTI